MNIPVIRTIAGVASFGVLIPSPVALGVGVAGVAAFAATRLGHFRPSTYLRVAEDSVASGAQRVARRAKNLSTRVRTEYAARQIDAAQRALETTFEELSAMSPAERAAYDTAQLQIMQRANELRAARRAKRVVTERVKRSADHAPSSRGC